MIRLLNILIMFVAVIFQAYFFSNILATVSVRIVKLISRIKLWFFTVKYATESFKCFFTHYVNLLRKQNVYRYANVSAFFYRFLRNQRIISQYTFFINKCSKKYLKKNILLLTEKEMIRHLNILNMFVAVIFQRYFLKYFSYCFGQNIYIN